ncbi:hypothetical protein D2A34_21335 [Clostridium chromiireducens]|uniref:Uncharacterized protein n=2 Tax=Clostridium chromiireducens TaxID=225345 RepID=A0A1V4I401_9CLOT|nr:hypothetical protein [Clostridium chromiireducens]OPJ54629.1 hypothetical protein CLCHR_48110 [Clostridium chromiireducens]RII32764.1 hypothetical protein D2A34_21335 [Clostridium chromiireducens]
MRENYNSLTFWENVISKNKTIRGHMFMQKPPTERSIYFHSLMFGDRNGINNIWGYFPNFQSIIGYIQYSFLQESFYRWIYGKERLVTKIPSLTVDKIIREGEKEKKINKDTAFNMRRDYEFVRSLWNLPSNRAEEELKKFVIDFNKKWMGDNREFIYFKIFWTAEELGEFVISSTLLTGTEEELEAKINMKIDEWKDICKCASTDPVKGEKFRKVLCKDLTEVF